SPKKILGIVQTEVTALKDKFGEDRRTQIVAGGVGEFAAEDLIPNELTVVLITADGYIKRLPPDTFRTQERGGKGVAGVKTKEEDAVEHLFSTNTHARSEEHTSELQSRENLVCRLLLEKKKKKKEHTEQKEQKQQ